MNLRTNVLAFFFSKSTFISTKRVTTKAAAGTIAPTPRLYTSRALDRKTCREGNQREGREREREDGRERELERERERDRRRERKRIRRGGGDGEKEKKDWKRKRK